MNENSGEKVNRRNVMLGALAAGVVSGLPSGKAFAQEPLTVKKGVELDGVGFSDVTPETYQKVLFAVNALNKKFPSIIEKIRITNSTHYRSTTTHETGLRVLEIDHALIKRSPEAVLDLVYHEGGHVVFDLLYTDHVSGTAEFENAARAMTQLNALWKTAEHNKVVYMKSAEWFTQLLYLEKRTNDEGVHYQPLPNPGELYASAFAVRELYGKELEANIQKGDNVQQAWARELISLLPKSTDFLKRRI